MGGQPGIVIALATGLVGAGCAGIRVESDYDRMVSFAALRTYEWLDSAGERERDLDAIDPFLTRRIQRAVDAEFNRRGYLRDAEGQPDFLVTASVVTLESGGGRAAYRRVRLACGPSVQIFFGFGHPYGFRLGHSFYRYPFPYFGYPRGFSCAYRLGFGYMWIPYYEGGGEYRPGTLVLDIISGENRELIWRGWADGALIATPRGEEISEYLTELVTEILKDFPPSS